MGIRQADTTTNEGIAGHCKNIENTSYQKRDH